MNPTIAGLALRSLIGQRRVYVLVALPLLLVVLAAAIHALTGDPVSARGLLVELGLAVVVPLVALLAANGVLGPEIDDGSIVYLLATPVSRYTVAVSKLVAAAGLAAVLCSAGLAGAALAGGVSTIWIVAGAVGGAVGALLYCALFVLFSAATRHGMIAGLLYVLVLERALGALLTGLERVSVQSVTRRLTELASGADLPVTLSTGYAVAAAVLILALGALGAGWRLSRFQLRGDE